MPCFASLVNRTEETCPPFSSLLAQSDNSSECVCNPGFFMADGSCVPCVAGYYCPGFYADANTPQRRMLSEGNDIVPCPDNSSSIMGADEINMCLCNSGFTALTCSQPPCDPLCTACEPGKYKTVVSNVVDCEPCPVNTYSASPQECSSCPNSTFSPLGSSEVTSCISPCDSGYTGPAGNCTACEAGTYKEASGSMPCTRCPEGHISGFGAMNCTACVPGKYAPSNSASSCIWCEIGKYSNASAASSAATCQYCPPGKYSDSTSSNIYFFRHLSNFTGWDLCVDCPPNTFSNPGEIGEEDYIKAQCLQCPANMTSTAGSALCSCDAGFYGTQGGCQPCGQHASSAPGAQVAVDCRCNAGYFRAEERCVACPVGFFRASEEPEQACVPCASGSSTHGIASESSDACSVCPANSFVDEAGGCVPCDEHASSAPGTVGGCRCDAGYAPDAGGCVPCAHGYYKGFAGNEECVACAPGMVGTGVQTRTHENVSCVACPANTYWALSGATAACVSCAPNSQSAAGSVNATSCQCDSGHYAAGGSCQACAPGTIKDDASSDAACTPCGGRTYTPYWAASECLACPANSTGHALSNDAESDCRCDPGFTGSDGGPCAACAPGKFKTVAGNQTCADCGPYAFWPLHADPTQNQCQSCPAHSARAPDAHGLNVLDCHCEAGHWRANESTCLQCPINFYCSGSLLACPLHSVSAAGSALIDHCRCEAGFFGDASSCAACPANAFCPEDALSPLACPPNSSTLGLISATSVSECTCHTGFHRDETSGVRCRPCGEISPCEGWETVACPPNSTAPWSATELSECVCDPGFRLQYSSDGNMTCVLCDEQEVCRGGLSTQCVAGAKNTNMRCVCAPGSHCAGSESSCTHSSSSSMSCSACPANHWCYNNSRTACRANEKAPASSTSRSACRCVDGYFRDALGACSACPLHHVCKNETRRPVSQYDENLRTLFTGTADLRDAVCVAGMFRTALTDLCKLCPRNFYCPQTGVALPNVVRCPENQFTDDAGAAFRGDCVCLAGFRLLGEMEEVRCLPCGIGERCQGGEVVEEFCHLQNKVASADHESCVCRVGYGLVNFECLECAPGFVKPAAGDTPCVPCASGTYALNATTCVPCPEHSDSRPGSTACQCAPPYEWTSNATCRLCPDDHFWQDKACYACPELSSSHPTPLMALGSAACRCAIGHIAAPLNVSGQLECSPCTNGTYEEGGECHQCGQRAWSLAASTTPTACVCNKIPNSTGTCHNQLVDGSCAGECASPPAACTQCEPGHHKPAYSTPGNSEKCPACAGGYFQAAAGASACDQCPQHEWHELLGQTSSDVCLCVQGFARPPTSSGNETADKSPCQACSAGHYKDWLGEQPCLPCAVGRYNPDVQATICHFCSDATADAEAWLRAIAPDVAAGVADNSTRMVLESNTTVRAAAVSVLECVCELGQEPRAVGNFSRCRQCMQGSFQEHKGHGSCTYCGGLSVDHGHALLHHYGLPGAGVTDFSHCAACPAFSGQNETLVGPGGLRMSDVSTCLCFPGHERVFSELGSECRNCSQHMVQTSISDDACIFCPAGHFFVDRHVPCQLCDLPQDGGDRHVGLVLNMLNDGLPWGTSEDDCVCRPGFERAFNSQCNACPTGKFRVSNLTRTCTACPQDTYQDSLAQLSCLSCPQNSSTLSLYGRSSVRDCVCGPGFQPLLLLEDDTAVCQPCPAGTFRTSRMHNEAEESCTLCPEDHYCPSGAITPVSCPRGEVSDAGSRTLDECLCPPGYGRESHANVSDSTNESPHGVCTVCARGWYAATRSNAACLACPENKTTTFTGASNLTHCTCVPGHGVETALPDAPCTQCLSGSFALGGSNGPCKSCGWGTLTAPFAFPESGDSCICNANFGVRVKTS
jgi:hypothetical protein